LEIKIPISWFFLVGWLEIKIPISYHIGWTTERDAREVIEAALAGGVCFVDTADYSGGERERRYGRYLTPKYREDVFIMTKTGGKDAGTVQRELDVSAEIQEPR